MTTRSKTNGNGLGTEIVPQKDAIVVDDVKQSAGHLLAKKKQKSRRKRDVDSSEDSSYYSQFEEDDKNHSKSKNNFNCNDCGHVFHKPGNLYRHKELHCPYRHSSRQPVGGIFELLMVWTSVNFYTVLNTIWRIFIGIGIFSIGQIIWYRDLNKSTALGAFVYTAAGSGKGWNNFSGNLLYLNLVCSGVRKPNCLYPEDLSPVLKDGNFNLFDRTSCQTYTRFIEIYKEQCGWPTASFFAHRYAFDVAPQTQEQREAVRPDWWKSGVSDADRGTPTLLPIPYGSRDPDDDLDLMKKMKGINRVIQDNIGLA